MFFNLQNLIVKLATANTNYYELLHKATVLHSYSASYWLHALPLFRAHRFGILNLREVVFYRADEVSREPERIVRTAMQEWRRKERNFSAPQWRAADWGDIFRLGDLQASLGLYKDDQIGQRLLLAAIPLLLLIGVAVRLPIVETVVFQKCSVVAKSLCVCLI